MISPPIFSRKKSAKEGYTHIRRYVKSEVWNLFNVVIQLNGLKIDDELDKAIQYWTFKIHKKDFVCGKCGGKLDKDNHIIIVNGDEFCFRCMNCVSV